MSSSVSEMMRTETTVDPRPAAVPRVRLAQWRWPSLPLPLTIGLAVLIGWALLSLIVPLTGRDPLAVTFGAKLLPPSWQNPFGTDALGRDVLARTAVAFRYDLLIAVGSVVLAAVVGLLLGAVAGAAPEWADNAVMRILDVISAFPAFILALVLAGALGAGMVTMVVAIAVVLAPQYARGTRAAILAERHKPYADAAHAMAIPPWRIVLVHLLPNSLSPTATVMAMDTATAIMIAAGLSFIGFGVQPPTPEWGLMINEGAAYIVTGEWWVTFFPGAAILSVVTAFVLLDGGLKRMREH
jgi:peptide/nickel transport system permease protein